VVPALLLRHAVEILADRAQRALHELRLRVDERHVEAARREHLRDAVAHRAAAHDGDLLHVGADGRGRLRRGSRHQVRSTASATALPPPRHSVARPVFLPRASMAWSSVTSTRVPLAPIGWPSATAPPFTLTRSQSQPSASPSASACAANASFASIRSKWPIWTPIFFISFCTASIGAKNRSLGSPPPVA